MDSPGTRQKKQRQGSNSPGPGSSYKDWRKWNLSQQGVRPGTGAGSGIRKSRTFSLRDGGQFTKAQRAGKRRKMTMKEVEEALLPDTHEIEEQPQAPAEETEEIDHEKESEDEILEIGYEEWADASKKRQSESDVDQEVLDQLQRESEEAESKIHQEAHTPPRKKLAVETKTQPKGAADDKKPIDLNEIYDYSVDYRGNFEPPKGNYQRLEFPKLDTKTQIQRQQEVVDEWTALVEKRKNLKPYDENLVQHTIDRLKAHRAELERLIAEEPSRPKYKDQRIKILQGCLQRYENPDEIVNVKAAIQAFEDGLLTNHMDQWTVFYNGKIVDKINSHRELLWSVRKPLYEEIYGKKGSIWIEPPSNDESKACVALLNDKLVSGGQWYIQQNLCLPWCDEKYAKEYLFLLDTGATDPMVHESDLLDLGMIKKDCPHVASRNVITAMGVSAHDFYPVFINHIYPQEVTDMLGDRIPMYPLMDTLCGILLAGSDRLSGLDLFRFCYTGTEPSTGRLCYDTMLSELDLRPGIVPGGTMTPRAWYTREWDARSGSFVVSNTVCSLTGRFPRLLNPEGARWLENWSGPYPYQYGREDRSPYPLVSYIPGHKFHPPTPDDIRDDRKYFWGHNQPYRDNRPQVWSAKPDATTVKTLYERDLYYGFHPPGNPPYFKRPLNPWQYKVPEEAHLAPDAQYIVQNIPQNPEGIRYWDDEFVQLIAAGKIPAILIPPYDASRGPGERIKPQPGGGDYGNMRYASNVTMAREAARALAVKNIPGAGRVGTAKVKRPRYIDED